MSKIRVAIVGVGNCANSLVQGVTYYKDAAVDQEIPGLMHAVIGGYHIRDIEFVAAYDVDAKKVGLATSAVLSGNQPDRGGKVPAASELLAVSHLGSQRAGSQ